ncbi:MAG TPA: chromosome segregation protein SMC [Syntrophorhabdales bacterium]|nr:chromosome segregation protein SMC [Syntrophorhabdales bacterium]
MKLLSLELLGFKSFLNRTVFRFSEGVTSLVGPNGCGKSNVVDAFIWVLGERGTKSLRVKEMGDVIFHGSNGKRPVNMAEVIIGLSEGDREVAIKRRIFRDGTNEYYINSDQVRLKDVQDFFLGTGIGLNSYAILEQGNIEYFAQMKPLERRTAIEEASGITRFEEKKRDAFERMEETKANLERVEDIYAEVVKSLKRTEEEWERLKVFNSLKEKLKEIDITLLADAYVKLERREAKLGEREAELQQEVARKEEERASVRETIDAKEEELSLADAVARQLELDIKEKEKDAESRLLELNYVEEERDRLSATITELQATVKELGEQGERTLGEVQALEIEIAQAAASLQEDEQLSNSLQEKKRELRGATEQLEAKLEEERNRLFVSMSSLTEVKNRILELERMEKERQVREGRRSEEEKRLRGKLVLLEEKGLVLKHQIDRESAEKAGIDKEEQELMERMRLLEHEMAQKRDSVERLKGEKRGREELFKKLATIGEKQTEPALPFKRLIDIVRTPEGAESALEKFFADEMEYHVLAASDPGAIADALREHSGNFIFFPEKGLFAQRDNDVEIRINWVENATEAIQRIEAGEEGIFIARDAGKDTYIDSRGLIVTSKEKRGISIREFREKMKLEKEIAQISDQLVKEQTSMGEVQNTHGTLGQAYQTVQQRKRQKANALAEKEKERIIIETEIRTIADRLKEFAWRIEGTDDQTPVSRDELIADQEKLEDEVSQINEALQVLKGDLDAARKRYDEAEKEFQEVSVNVERKKNSVRSLSEEAERKKSAAEEHEKNKAAAGEKIVTAETSLSEATQRIKELGESHAQLSETCEKASARYNEMKQQLGDLHQEKSRLQEGLQRVSDDLEKVRSKWEGLEREKAVLQERKEMILERLRTEYAIEELDEKRKSAPPGTEAERQKIADELSAMGEVNFRAEKEYKELKERSEFLETQKSDLTQAMDSLRKTISKIDAVSKDLFIETFDQINEAFKRYTQMLFKGGKGTLSINPDTSGVELYVQPPGKRVIRMELFSGGEKALISLAFLLSLMDTKPSPFTLMDEIDAPLDDANLASLMEIVKTISKKTQIVLITHNRLTMECSNTMYGITMEDEGISKIVSVRL